MTNYEKSNSISEVRLTSFDKSYYRKLIKCGDSAKDRQITAQKLINYLCDKFKIKRVPVYVKDWSQPHRLNESGNIRSKTFGRYWVSTKIEIWNKTAIRNQTISINVFADTLIHEFIHHYDTYVLGIDSIHSTGFYKRISDLLNKLK